MYDHVRRGSWGGRSAAWKSSRYCCAHTSSPPYLPWSLPFLPPVTAAPTRPPPSLSGSTSSALLTTHDPGPTRARVPTSFRVPQSSAQMVPTVQFYFELTPLKVKKTERRAGSFFSFATRCAALIGGLFTVAGILDSILYSSTRQIEKLNMGKQG